MKKDISFTVWLSVFFGGLRQFLCNIFSWKSKTPFWRIIWAILTLCIVTFTCLLSFALYKDFQSRSKYQERYDSYVSRYFKYRNNGYNEGKSYIYDARTKKKIIKNIDWIAVPEDGDSLIIVAKDGKRGFVNRYTAEAAIPFKYDAAWSFTGGVAGVCEGDSVYFIDHYGNPIHDRKFARQDGYDRYVYHGNYAAIPFNGKYGLIDRTGKWAIQPEYDDIHIGARNMWYIGNNNKYGVIGSDGKLAISMDYENVWIHSQNGITVQNIDNSLSRYGYDGTLLDAFVYNEVYHLAYYINEVDEERNQKQALDKEMLKYSANYRYGLMRKDGTPITPPLYEEIEVVTPGVYQCHIPKTGECVMVNSNGEKINK